jgi:SAM-dependent methyltransferase
VSGDDRVAQVLSRERMYHSQSRQAEGVARFLNSNRLTYSPQRNDFAFSCVREKLFEALKRKGCNPESRLLNVACGAGEDMPYVLPLTRRVVCLDIARAVLEVNRERFCVPCVEADALRIPMEERSFDYVLANGFLHHVVELGLDGFLAEFKRILAPGGWVILAEPNLLFPVFVATRPFHKLFPGFSGLVEHERPISSRQLLRCIRRAGFAEVECEPASYVHNRFPLPVSKAIYRLHGVLRALPWVRWLGYTTLACGRKPTTYSERL